MKVGDLIKLKDGTIGLIVKFGTASVSGARFFVIHTGEAFYPDIQHIEGWELMA